jgi:hypothetical protein
VLSRLRFETLALLAISVAGTVAAIRAGDTGFTVLFVVTGLLAALPLLARRRRRSVELRADLGAWLDLVAASTGETATDILDRSVSAYRAAMQQPVNDG